MVDAKFRESVTKLLRERQFQQALNMVDAELAKTPQHAGLIHLRGAVFDAGGRYDDALSEYERALKIDPVLRVALSDRIGATYMLGRNGKVIELANAFLATNPKDRQATNLRGAAYLNLEQFNEALADFNTLVTEHPKYVLGWYNRGRTYFQMKDVDRAMADLGQALTIDPKHAPSLGQRGLIKLGRKDVAGAEADFKAALAVDRKATAAAKGMQGLQAVRAMEILGQIKKGG